MSNAGTPMIPPRFLFRFAAPCRYREDLGSSPTLALGTEHKLLGLAQLEGAPQFADVRTGWSDLGMGFSVEVHGKAKPLWCRESRLAESDGLNVWLDTRPTQMIHRATRFCHHFAFLPAGNNRNADAPTAGQLLINRAKEQADPTSLKRIQLRSEVYPDGYLLEVFLEAAALTGFNPREAPQIGFTYLVHDAELGQQTFSSGPEFPYREDPSLWARLDLAR